jgi:hypothetical protein
MPGMCYVLHCFHTMSEAALWLPCFVETAIMLRRAPRPSQTFIGGTAATN